MRDFHHVQAIAYAQVGRDFGQDGKQKFLERVQARIQRRGRQDERIHLPHGPRYKQARHRTTHAVAQQNERRAFFHAQAGAVHNVGQVVDQALVGCQSATRPARLAVAVLVVAAHGKAPVIQAAGNVVVTARVLAQPMHDDDHTAQRLAGIEGPVLHGQVVAVTSNESGQGGFSGHASLGAMRFKAIERSRGQLRR